MHATLALSHLLKPITRRGRTACFYLAGDVDQPDRDRKIQGGSLNAPCTARTLAHAHWLMPFDWILGHGKACYE